MAPLGPERWKRVSPYLDEALAMPAETRAEWIAELRRRDASLADDVEALFEARSAASREDFLGGTPPVPLGEGSLAGQQFGAYTLDSLIGEGGMGSVWLGRRSDGRFEGLAAVKLLNASLIGRAAEERFRREGTILARLAHPHVARLLDAGVSASGRPYLVLEYVQGEPIDAYCDGRRLGIEARVELFLDVLEAVSHAHANLIVHRDIKPSNVLVDRDGQVKLLDFGIAKLLGGEGEAGAATALTHEAGNALTPQFAAPEQITGDPVTTATDVHALGTLLYMLLTGRHPTGSAHRTAVEFARAILEVDPPRASETVSAREAANADSVRIAVARAATADGLRRRLRGDLDTIVGRALKKAPAERYPSVGAFAEDLRRHLRHEPVLARPDTWSYRVGKFVRRNRAGVAGAAVVIVAALAGAAGILWQAREASRQRDIARAQLDRATAANEFLGFLITDATPSGKKVSASDLFEEGERLVDKQFAGNPALRADMLLMIGERYLAASSWDKAIAVLQRSADISRDAGVRARDLCSIGLADMATGRPDAAKATIRKALAELPGDAQYSLARAACLLRSSQLGYYDFEPEPMILSAQEALRILEASPTMSGADRIDALAALGYGYYLKLDYDAADRTYAEVMASIERAGRGNTLAAADSATDWGVVHFEGEIVKTEPLFRHALELHRSIDGADAVAPICLHNYALVLFELARYDEAEALFEEAIRNARARGDGRIATAAALHLADLHTERGELARASTELEGVDLDASDPMTARLRDAHLAYSLGLQSAARGNARRARELLTESVELYEQTKSALQVSALIALSRAERSLGRPAEALAAAAQAQAVAESIVPKAAPSYLIGRAEEAIAEAQLASGDARSARVNLCSAADQLERTLGPEHPEAARARRLAGSPLP